MNIDEETTRTGSRTVARGLGVAIAIMAAAAGACRPGTGGAPQVTGVHVTDDGLSRLARARVLFGHQSVGANIVDGLQSLIAERRSGGLRIVEIGRPDELDRPALAHFRVGENLKPHTKIDDFARWVDGSTAAPIDIASFKLCYVDIDAGTDVAAIFEHYRRVLSELKARHPQTIFLHVTTPLESVQGGLKGQIKRLLGRPLWGAASNAARDRYNDLLRQEYAGREPIFDLAEAEATLEDGSRVTFDSGGRTLPAMAPDFTDDGGHLNARGRRVVAERLLAALTALAR